MNNKYFLWTVNDSYPDKVQLRFMSDNEFDSCDFSLGSQIEITKPIKFSVISKCKKSDILKLDQIMCAGGMLLSPKFCAMILEEQFTGIQLLPSAIETEADKIDDFKLVNIVCLIDALDKERSTFRKLLPREDDSPMVPVTRVFRDDALKDFDIGVVKDSLGTKLVSEKFVQQAKKCGLKGCGFQAINVFSHLT